jgi:hypothetical protein
MDFNAVANGRRLRRHPRRCAGLADGCKSCPDRQLAGDEIGAARGAARFGVIVSETHALGGQLVEVRRLAGHDSLVVRADIEPADVVTHDYEDVGLLFLRQCRRCGDVNRGAKQDSHCGQSAPFVP